MAKLTNQQIQLARIVEKNPGLTTAELRRAMGGAAAGYYQAYESHLRDRLFRLESHGLVRSEETKNGTHVIARRWHPQTQEVSA